MREAVEKHGSPAPVFESTGFFTAIFRPLAGLTRTLPRKSQVKSQVKSYGS